MKLVADIGATNARFALATEGRIESDVVVLPTSTPQLLEAAFAQFSDVTSACLAVAGPVAGGRATITNANLSFAEPELTAMLGCPVKLINDFAAVSYSTRVARSLVQVGSGEVDPVGVRAAIGPGSGLGMGILVPTSNGWIALDSEGGHADLAVASALEAELWSVLSAQASPVTWESVLSGPGIVRLHQAVCSVWGAPTEPLTSERIVALGVGVEDPVCHQTLEVFLGWLGAAAGALALTVCARGGTYIAGGIVPTIADQLASSPMRRRFDDRGPMAELARALPLFVICDEYPGLLGASIAQEET